MSIYTAMIQPVLDEVGSKAPAALIESLMRLDPNNEGSTRTLDGLSGPYFRAEAAACAAMFDLDPNLATEIAGSVGYRPAPATPPVLLYKVELPAMLPDFPDPGTSFFVSLDGEKFYETSTDVTTAPLEALQEFWAACEPRYDPALKVTHLHVHATARYVRSLAHNGWPVTEIAWQGASA
jgi:hypothetical protein